MINWPTDATLYFLPRQSRLLYKDAWKSVLGMNVADFPAHLVKVRLIPNGNWIYIFHPFPPVQMCFPSRPFFTAPPPPCFLCSKKLVPMGSDEIDQGRALTSQSLVSDNFTTVSFILPPQFVSNEQNIFHFHSKSTVWSIVTRSPSPSVHLFELDDAFPLTILITAVLGHWTYRKKDTFALEVIEAKIDTWSQLIPTRALLTQPAELWGKEQSSRSLQALLLQVQRDHSHARHYEVWRHNINLASVNVDSSNYWLLYTKRCYLRH